MDGLLLSVLPVYAAWRGCTLLGWTERWPGRIGAAVLALLVSMLVIGVYHLGYPEFRGPQVLMVMAGVGVQTLGYIITRSPIAPVISHVAMHVAAVLYGLHSVSQLPPHYWL
jgi:membrane protease YdiL (CAAX protease family)